MGGPARPSELGPKSCPNKRCTEKEGDNSPFPPSSFEPPWRMEPYSRPPDQGSLHLIHGIDVARAILAIHSNFDKASGQRWLLTDCRIYDWWDLASAWGADMSGGAEGQYQRGPQPVWVRELMREEGIRVLPRGVKSLGRALDSRDFWHEFGLSPAKVLLNK